MKVQSFDQLLKSQGFNFTGDEVVNNLAKALATANSGPLTAGSGAGPLMLQNLDSLMTEVLITQKHFKLFNFFNKVPSAQPYYEWNRKNDFGTRRGSVGFAEGGAPTGSASAYVRNGLYTKYYGVKGGVTHQFLMTGQNGGAAVDPTFEENKNRALELFERVERELVHGDKNIKDGNGNEVHFDGLLALLTAQNSANVIDMQGAPFTFEQLDQAAEDLVTTGKRISVDGYTCFQSPHVASGLTKQYAARNLVRFNKDEKVSPDYTPGFRVPGYDSQFGNIAFDHSILFDEVPDGKPASVALAGVPASPTTPTAAVANDATSNLAAGTYYYSAGAFNDTGESLVTTSAAVVVGVGQKATITVPNVVGATGYRVYRGILADGSDAKWVGRIADPPANADGVFVDKGQWNTVDSTGKKNNGLAIVIEPDPGDVCIAQLAPLLKMPLPQVDTTFPFLLLLYIVFVLKASERVKIYKNCGQYISP